MLISAILSFALAAILGIYLLTYILQNKNTPKGVAFTHGPLAVLGLIILIIYAILYKPAPLISIMIFLLAAFIGLFIIYRDLIGKSIPKWLAIVHGLTAIFGFILLILFVFRH